MKVKCLKGSKSQYVTKGCEYEVIERSNLFYNIIDNTGTERCFKKSRFEKEKNE